MPLNKNHAPAIMVKRLNVAYESNTVLHDLSFEIAKGKITAVIGPNGSGKSTLFKALLGLINYTGEINVFKKPIRDVLDRVAYVPQYFDFDRTLPITVGEFLDFIKVKTAKAAKEICTEVQVDSLKNKLLGELSGGQLQRVLLAQALMKSPDLLLLDEAAAGIDIQGAKTFYELIKHVNKEHGVTVIMISHEINMMYHFADNLICLNRDLVCNGPAKIALTNDVLKKLYGDDLHVHHHEHVHYD
jgi:zinc transport system ATP-binding protein